MDKEENEMAPVIERALQSANTEVDEYISYQKECLERLQLLVEMSDCPQKRNEINKIIEKLKRIGLLNADGSPSSIYYGDD